MRSLDGHATHRDDTRFTGRVCHIAVIVLAVVSSGCDNVHARIDGFVGCVPRCSPRTNGKRKDVGCTTQRQRNDVRTVLNAPIDCISNDGVAAATVRAKGFGHQQINILCDPFEPTVGYQEPRHRRTMSVVVVGFTVAVDEVLPSDQVDALQIGVIHCNARIHDAGDNTASGQRIGRWLNQFVVGRVPLKRDLAGPKQDGTIAEHHGCKVATGEDEGETERDADDEPDGAHVAAFMVKFSLIRGRLRPKLRPLFNGIVDGV